MAQTFYEDNVSPDFALGFNVNVNRLGIIHEPVATPTGATTAPYAALLMELQAVGSPVDNIGNKGKLRVIGTYADNSTIELVNDDAPFSSAESGAINMVGTTPIWCIVRADGKVYQEGPPSDDTVLLAGSTPATRERHALDLTKRLSSVAFYWTDN